MRSLTALKMAAVTLAAVGMVAVPVGIAEPQGGGTGDIVLKQADIEKLMPASVYYKGQSATTQMRNSGGVKSVSYTHLGRGVQDSASYKVVGKGGCGGGAY